MEQLKETIELDIDEPNELVFAVKVEGITSVNPARVRLVCERDGMSFMFPGREIQGSGHVQFDIPKMSDMLEAGSYSSRVEVLVENRYFEPVNFELEFKKTVSVVAEAVKKPEIKRKPPIKVSAAPVIKRPSQQPTNPSQNALKAEQKVSTGRSLKERYSEKRGPRAVSDDEVRSAIRSIVKGFKFDG